IVRCRSSRTAHSLPGCGQKRRERTEADPWSNLELPELSVIERGHDHEPACLPSPSSRVLRAPNILSLTLPSRSVEIRKTSPESSPCRCSGRSRGSVAVFTDFCPYAPCYDFGHLRFWARFPTQRFDDAVFPQHCG